jgi:phage terminase large subunit
MSNYNINISSKVFNRSFRHLINASERYLVLFGGAGSGKSYFIVERFIYHILSKSKFNLLVVRQTGKSNRNSTFALFQQVISNWNLGQLFDIKQGDMRITCKNGNEVIFEGLDDVEKLKSVTFKSGELTNVWIEEASEILEPDFNQLNVRLRGKGTKKQIVISFNPIDINHWLKKRFIDRADDNIKVHHSTYLDNDFLDDDYKRLLESYKDTDPYYYQVYCLGEWGVLGKTIFDAEKVSKRMQMLSEPIKRGYFEYSYDGLQLTNIRFIESKTGYISIYEEPSNLGYCIGGDTAGEGSDFFVGQVLSDKGKQVAVLRHQMDSDLYTKQMYCLGKYYQDALISIEVNFDSFPVRELERLGYENMYIREAEDTFTGAIKKAHGFITDKFTRPRIISQLVEIVRESTFLFNDKETLQEMLTFVRNDKGRAEAQQGAHDDCIMSIAIAFDSIAQIPKKVVYKDDFVYNDFLSFGS